MSSYTDSMCYETFIRRAFKCDYNSHNSKNAYFQNLIETENGSTSTKHLVRNRPINAEYPEFN